MIDRILCPKRAEIARMLAVPSFAPKRHPGGGVPEALTRPPGAPLRLLAEIKFRSPSAGMLSRALAAPDRALAYAEGGACMISVLTDGPFFGGSYDDLAACREALERSLGATRPRLLCKEFILDAVQLERAADAGADAALLIARIVTASELRALADAARARGLEPVVEVATEAELAVAQAASARVIGVNARDLNTLRLDSARAQSVLRAIPPPTVAIHLSGLATPDDVSRIAGSRADAALVGEALMRVDDPRPLLRAMVESASSARGLRG
jgi:indole-3-glycerol phosphate synthase